MLLQVVYAVFRETADWPTHQYVDKTLDAAGADLTNLLERISPGLVATSRHAGIAPQPGDQVRLTLSGVSQAGGADDTDFFIRVLQWLVEREQSFRPTEPSEPEELRISSQEIEAVFDARGLPAPPGAIARVFRLVEGEPDIYTALNHSNEQTQWEIAISPRIRRFRGIDSLDEYLERRTTPPTQQQLPRPAFQIPVGSPEIRIPETTDATHSRISRLHPLIRDAAGDLYHDDHFSSAIFEAFKAIEIRVRRLSGVDGSGRDLMAQAFRGDDPLIALNQGTSRIDRDEQEGFRLIFMGATQGIRNPKAHDNPRQDDRDRAYDYLAMASLLMRRLDDAEKPAEPGMVERKRRPKP